MVGSGKYSSEDVTVYYFEKSTGEAYDLELQNDGVFKKDFGEGFLDEAARFLSTPRIGQVMGWS